MMWEIDYLTAAGALRSDVGLHLGEFLATSDANRAAGLTVQIESAVAPVSGGLSNDAPAVVTVILAGLSRMRPELRVEALLLLTQILGSAEALETAVASEVGRLIEAALPTLAAIIEVGTDADIAQGIDLISIMSMRSRPAANRAYFYLSRVVATTRGAIQESAQRELAEVEKALV